MSQFAEALVYSLRYVGKVDLVLKDEQETAVRDGGAKKATKQEQ